MSLQFETVVLFLCGLMFDLLMDELLNGCVCTCEWVCGVCVGVCVCVCVYVSGGLRVLIGVKTGWWWAAV